MTSGSADFSTEQVQLLEHRRVGEGEQVQLGLGGQRELGPGRDGDDVAARFRELGVHMAPGAPPELGADVLLRLIESGAIKEKAWQLELADQAFALARKARFSLGITGAVLVSLGVRLALERR